MANSELREGAIEIIKAPSTPLTSIRSRTVAKAARMRESSMCDREERPCPYVGCRYHLLIEVTLGGGLRLNQRIRGKRPFLPAEERDARVVRRWIDRAVELVAYAEGDTCALDVARRGGQTLAEIGRLRGVTKEMVRLEEQQALRRLRRKIDDEM